VTWSDCISSSGWAPLPLPGVDCSEDSRGDLLIGRDGSSAVRFRPVPVAFEFAGADKGKATRESIVQVGWSWFQVVRKGESRSRSQNGSSHASASECRLTVPSWENLTRKRSRPGLLRGLRVLSCLWLFCLVTSALSAPCPLKVLLALASLLFHRWNVSPILRLCQCGSVCCLTQSDVPLYKTSGLVNKVTRLPTIYQVQSQQM
jgi:hypothetical protein